MVGLPVGQFPIYCSGDVVPKEGAASVPFSSCTNAYFCLVTKDLRMALPVFQRIPPEGQPFIAASGAQVEIK